jgi:hypothetical protein
MSIEKAGKEVLAERRELGLKYILEQDPELWMETVKYNRKIDTICCDSSPGKPLPLRY